MKDLSIYFQPVETEGTFEEEQLGSIIERFQDHHFPVLRDQGTALLFCPENRRGDHAKSNDLFRQSLYSLYTGTNWEHKLYDLGTIKPGESIDDTIHAVAISVSELIKNNITPILVGGTQDLTVALYEAYSELEQLVNLTSIDHQLDIGSTENEINQNGWLSHLLLKKPCYLFNYSNIGAQSHYNPPKSFKLFEDLYFDVIRLGLIKSDIKVAEPYLRNTDILSVDLNSIQASSWNSKYFTNPNGIAAYEACGLMRYAGISDKLGCIGLFNQSLLDSEITGHELIAQLIWYFNEGYAHRKGDFPVGSKKKYKKFRVHFDELNEEIVFFKSDKSSRWWMEVPYPSKSDSKFMRHQLVPCSYKEYEEAMKGDIPDLWWKTYQKIS